MSDEAATPVAAPAPEVTHPSALGHAAYIFGVVTAITMVIAAVVWMRTVKHAPKPKAQPAPVAVIVHAPEVIKDQERVEPVAPPIDTTVQSEEEQAATSIEDNAAPARHSDDEASKAAVPSSASEPAPHEQDRKRTTRPYRIDRKHAVDEREVGFWASFMRAAAEFSKGPSR